MPVWYEYATNLNNSLYLAACVNNMLRQKCAVGKYKIFDINKSVSPAALKNRT